MTESTYIACSQCDLLLKLVPLEMGNKALCPRCNHLLTANHCNAKNRVIAFSITAILFLVLSNCFPFLTFSAQGHEQTVTLIQSIYTLVTQNFFILALLIFSSVIVIPVVYLLSVIYVYVSLKRARLLAGTYTLLKLIGGLQHWNMAEIFLIGILVSFIKIASLAEITLGVSFWAYVFFILSMTIVMSHIDKHQIWQWIKHKEKTPAVPEIKNRQYQSCHVCTDVIDSSKSICATCGARLHQRVNKSIQKTWALLFTSILLYIPANILPVMETKYLGEKTASTILGGIVVLWQHGSYPIALIIFVASVLVPVGKIIALAWLCFGVQVHSHQACKQKTILYRITELVGRWSMIDVFVVAILVALIRRGEIMSVYPGWGAVAFSALVIVTVLAALSFDPRLIWDPINNEKINE